MSNNCGERDDDSISITWCIDDVRSLAPDIDLTYEQCREVLAMADNNHDASIGINWDVLRVYLDVVLDEGEL